MKPTLYLDLEARLYTPRSPLKAHYKVYAGRQNVGRLDHWQTMTEAAFVQKWTYFFLIYGRKFIR